MKQHDFDVIIVLGFEVYEDGTMPLEAKNRAKKAAELYKSNYANRIIFTGDVSYSHDYHPLRTEAKSMADAAKAFGVPFAAIILEEKARDTEENAKFSKVIVDEHGWKNLLFVTADVQLERQSFICRQVYGDDYNINFAISENGLNPEELENEKKLEQEKWKKVKR